MRGKPVTESQTITSEIILYSDLNSHGTVFGGRLVSIIDKAAAISARRHAGGAIVTAAIDSLVFARPATNGSVITVRASVNRVFNTSMEVGALVTSLPPDSNEEIEICTAYLTFVRLDANSTPVPVPPVLPETEAQQRRFDQALVRRENRLRLRAQLAGDQAV